MRESERENRRLGPKEAVGGRVDAAGYVRSLHRLFLLSSNHHHHEPSSYPLCHRRNIHIDGGQIPVMHRNSAGMPYDPPAQLPGSLVPGVPRSAIYPQENSNNRRSDSLFFMPSPSAAGSASQDAPYSVLTNGATQALTPNRRPQQPVLVPYTTTGPPPRQANRAQTVFASACFPPQSRICVEDSIRTLPFTASPSKTVLWLPSPSLTACLSAYKQ